MLTDVTKCIGCEKCVTACKVTNGTGDFDAPHAWQGSATDLSSTRWTTIKTTKEGRYVREHCRHCLEPGCAAACPVGALKVTDTGAVSYNPTICMGCRYCMMACPFRMTRYEWESAKPRVRKCILCYDKIIAGELDQPACTHACPTGATIFGSRDAMLAEAKRRIASQPGKYINHIWGEHEVGGTSVLYISDVELDAVGWPDSLTNRAVPEYAMAALSTVPMTFLTVVGVMAGIHWVVRRRQKLAGELAAAEAIETTTTEDTDTTGSES